MNKLLSIFFIGFAAIFFVVGANKVLSQHMKITTYVQTEAEVLAARVETHVSRSSKGSTSRTYEPVIKYEYYVDNKRYACETVFPINLSAGHSWAHGVVAKYKVGTKTNAYYDPVAPFDAFLIKQYLFYPYIFVLAPMILIAVGVAMLLGVMQGSSPRKIKRPVRLRGGKFQVMPFPSIVQRRQASLIVGSLMAIVGSFVLQYFNNATSYETEAYVITGIYAALTATILSLFLYFHLLLKNVKEARILTDFESFQIGGEIKAIVNQVFKKELLLEYVKFGLTASVTTKTKSGNKTSTSTDTYYEEWTDVLENQTFGPGHHLSFSTTVKIPDAMSASTPPGTKGYPFYAWRLELKVSIVNSPDFRCKYPIFLKPRSFINPPTAAQPIEKNFELEEVKKS
ncbi:MAG: DUF3592 domain-containing protein [bacterium]|nr:DUF3592 domain-containing protein [bacterium]